MDWLGVILVPAFLVCLYLLPAFVAGKRKHKNGAAILVLNLLLGWTVLGWIIALVWACTSNVED
jgi:RsiW-degrading membrane proteinase PrsW (M82 family)